MLITDEALSGDKAVPENISPSNETKDPLLKELCLFVCISEALTIKRMLALRLPCTRAIVP